VVDRLTYTLNFEEVNKASLPMVGGKNASLGEMIRAGIRVPPGFAVTTDSYLNFITEAGIKDKVFKILSEVNPEDVTSLDGTSAEVQKLINEALIPSDIEKAIREEYCYLCDKCGVERMPVAVRSSATAEDLPTASFAGQQDTYLWIEGTDEVIRRVQKCWASLFTPRAISYRIKNNFPHEKVLISVGVQKMVNSRTAGVMFTLNPVNGDPSKVVIEGSWGLGEAVVSGSVTPDKFVVDKIVLEINERTISPKNIQCVYDPEKGEVVHADVVSEIQNNPCIDDSEIKELVRIAKRIEEHYGCPQDIEWAIDKGLLFPENIFTVQSRPETVWSQRRKEPIIGNKTAYELLMEKALTPVKVKL
jgi:pyruvate,water dikinase